MRKIRLTLVLLSFLLCTVLAQFKPQNDARAQALGSSSILQPQNLMLYNQYLPVVLTSMIGEMVYIPSGVFQMGCDPDRNAGLDCTDMDETPLHSVYLTTFWMDKTEVTNARYAQCVTAGGCNQPANISSVTRSDYYTNPDYAKFPVINVTWHDASAFCAWAGKRLPTEAEWEKASRGVMDTRPYPWGDEEPSCATANILGCTGIPADTSEVGSYPAGASPLSVQDMIGNALEWVNDWYQFEYYENSPYINPPGPDTGDYKGLRGGAFDINLPYYLRLPFRNNAAPDTYENFVGFRCAVNRP